MNFNVYIKKEIGESLNKIAQDMHRSRNSIVTEALEEWLEKHTASQWPNDFFNFSPTDDVPDFKAMRRDLAALVDKDPLE